MEIDFCVKNYLENYNLLIEQLVLLFNEKEIKEYILVLNNESKDKKWLRGVKFQQEISIINEEIKGKVFLNYLLII